MSHWNYRLVKYEDESYGIHEVYYNAEGIPDAVTERAVGPVGDSLEEILTALARMVNDVTNRTPICMKYFDKLANESTSSGEREVSSGD